MIFKFYFGDGITKKSQIGVVSNTAIMDLELLPYAKKYFYESISNSVIHELEKPEHEYKRIMEIELNLFNKESFFLQR